MEHGKEPLVICIPLEVEKQIAKFPERPLTADVRDWLPTISGFKIQWDAEEFQFNVEETKVVYPDPPKTWKQTKW